MIKKLTLGILLCLLGACSVHVGNGSVSVQMGRGADRDIVAAVGSPVTRQASAQEFDRLRIEAPVTVEVVDGSQWSYTITGCENQLGLIGIECGPELHIYNKKDNLQFKDGETVCMVITLPGALREINVGHTGKLQLNKKALITELTVGVDGMGEITIPETETGTLTTRISGMGRLNIGRMQVGKLRADASGMGKFSAAGEAGALSLTGSGMAQIDLGGLIVKSAESNVSGMSKADLCVTESLACNVSGMAHLNYGGEPVKVSPEVSGMGHLKKK